LRTFNTESPERLIHEIIPGLQYGEHGGEEQGNSSRLLRVLREFFFVPSVLNSLSSMTEWERLNKITETIIGAAIRAPFHNEIGRGSDRRFVKQVPATRFPNGSSNRRARGRIRGVVPATGRELPLREQSRGFPRRPHTTKGTGGLNLLIFSDKIEQDGESRKWQVVCSRRGGSFSLLTIYHAPFTLVAK
jgi:hypothetical protein